MEKTGGRFFSFGEVYWEEKIPELYRERIEKFSAAEPQTVFKGIVATGYRTITLGKPLSSTSGWDSDNDGLTDWEEVNTDLLIWNRDGSITLPTLKYCVENYSEDSYVIAGLERFKRDVMQNGVPSNIYEEYFDNIMADTRILPIHSHPGMRDTDGDRYNDYAETRVYQSSPLKNDVRTSFIDYICIYDEDGIKGFESNYSSNDPFNIFKVFNDKNHSFGGKQEWFDPELVNGGNEQNGQLIIDEREMGNYDTIKSSGCGLIASVDILLYYNRIGVNKNDDGTLNKKSYMEKVLRLHKTDMTVRDGGMMLFEVADWIEIYGLNTEIMKISSAREEDIENRIYENVVNKNPIVLLVDSFNNKNEPQCRYLQKCIGNEFYKEKEIELNEIETVGHHFMVITGIVEDRVKGKTYLQISTWGRKYYIDLDDIIYYAKENTEAFWAVNGLIFVEE